MRLRRPAFGLLVFVLLCLVLAKTAPIKHLMPMAAAREAVQMGGTWLQRGPEGGAVEALALDSSNTNMIFAVVSKTIYRSTNGGATWQLANDGLSDLRVEKLVLLNGRTLFAGTNKGVYRTTDGGISWSATNSNLPEAGSITALAIPEGANAGRLLAAVFTGDPNTSGLFWSNDNGALWNDTKGLPAGQFILSLAFAPGNPNEVYAGTTSAGIYKSNDGGLNWIASNSGFLGNEYVASLTVDGTGVVYAGTRASDSPGDGLVFKSTNGGASWQATALPRAGGTNGNVALALAVDRNSGNTVYAATERGIHKSTNGGASWDRVVNGLRAGWHTGALALDRSNPQTIFAGTMDGIYKSTNGGGTWQLASNGVYRLPLTELTTDPTNPNVIYVASAAGAMLKSTDRGQTWTSSLLRPITPENSPLIGLNVLVDPKNTNTVYAGSVQLGVYRSTNGGQSWASPNAGYARTVERIHLSSEGSLYQVDGSGNSDISILRSDNGGRSWQAWFTSGFTANDLVTDPASPYLIYVGGQGRGAGNSVFKSTSGGPQWTPASNGLPSGVIVRRLALAASNPATLYAQVGSGAGTQIYKTTNGAGNWQNVTNGLVLNTDPIGGLNIDPRNADVLYVWGSNGIFRTTNGGASWQNLSNGLGSLDVTAVTIANDGTLYASTGRLQFPGTGNSLYVFQPSNLSTGNTPPTIAAVSGISSQAGGPAANALIANVKDAESSDLTVTAANAPVGLTISNISNNNGAITANVGAACQTALGNQTVTLTVTDGGGLTATATLTINVTANTPPALGAYSNHQAGVGETLTVRPTRPPSDSGTLRLLRASASSGFTGTLAVNQTTGEVTLSNVAPAGNYTITVEALDNCDASATQTFQLNLPNPNACTNAPPGLVSWYRGESTASDAGGQNTATARGELRYRSGRVGQGFYFNGTNAYLEVPDANNLKPQNVTLETWVNFESLTTPNAAVPGLQYIIQKRNSRVANFEGYSLLKQRVNNAERLSFIISSISGTQVSIHSTTAIETGRWYHVVATYDGTNSRLYVNGALEASQQAGFTLDYGTRPLFIGTSGESFFDGKFQGVLDEVSVYNRALSAQEAQTLYLAGSGKCVARVVTVSAADYRGEQFAPAQIVASFGSNLAPNGQVATTLPLPTSLANTQVQIRDAAGVERMAPLFFVSPTQVNYQIPPQTAAGIATVTMMNGGNQITGTLNIVSVAPSLFAADSSGQGVAAALALRVTPSGSQRFEPVARYDATQQRIVAVPVDLSNANDQMFLVLYGTGIRGRSALNAVKATLGGTELDVLYAGQQGSLIGVDQINLRLPRSLAGRGELELLVSIDGKPANPLKVSVR